MITLYFDIYIITFQKLPSSVFCGGVLVGGKHDVPLSSELHVAVLVDDELRVAVPPPVPLE